MDITNPPADPNEWSDEQWIEWLVATDEAAEIDSTPSVLKRAAGTKSGQVLGQAMREMAGITSRQSFKQRKNTIFLHSIKSIFNT